MNLSEAAILLVDDEPQTPRNIWVLALLDVAIPAFDGTSDAGRLLAPFRHSPRPDTLGLSSAEVVTAELPRANLHRFAVKGTLPSCRRA
jgi:hypothetical protein